MTLPKAQQKTVIKIRDVIKKEMQRWTLSRDDLIGRPYSLRFERKRLMSLLDRATVHFFLFLIIFPRLLCPIALDI